MAIRILLLLISAIITVNLVIIIVGYICNVNVYEKYGKQILSGFGILILLIVVIYITMSILGLV